MESVGGGERMQEFVTLHDSGAVNGSGLLRGRAMGAAVWAYMRLRTVQE